MIERIRLERQADVAQLGVDRQDLGLEAGPPGHRQQDPQQRRDNGDDHQHFDQCERSFHLGPFNDQLFCHGLFFDGLFDDLLGPVGQAMLRRGQHLAVAVIVDHI